jgi:predicted nucleic acid-binding protein
MQPERRPLVVTAPPGRDAIGVADLVIAATAVRLGLPLATLNLRHLPMFEGLEPAYRR